MAALFIGAVLLAGGPDAGEQGVLAAAPAADAGPDDGTAAGLETGDDYGSVLRQWLAGGYADARSTLTVPGRSVSGHGGQTAPVIQTYRGQEEALVWRNESSGWIEYEVEVEQAGLYELALRYLPLNGAADDEDAVRYEPVALAVTVDGSYPFREARSVEFSRHFVDKLPLGTDAQGNELRPAPLPLREWRLQAMQDAEGRYALPFKFYLAAGVRKIRLQGEDALAIAALVLRPPGTVSPYAEAAGRYPAADPGRAGQIGTVTIEAERTSGKNAVAIQMQSDRDALATPRAGSWRTVFNALGGAAWKDGRQAATWNFSVPKSGVYRITLRAYQNYNTDQSSFRTVYIDGKVPFAELLAYRIPYAPGWRGETLRDGQGEPFDIYLEAGGHTLTLEATIAPFHEALVAQERALELLNEAALDLNKLVAGSGDKNRTWNIAEEYPALPDRLRTVAVLLQGMADSLLAANGGATNGGIQSIRTAIGDLEGLLRYPDEIPYKLSLLGGIRGKVADVRSRLLLSPLLLDKIHIAPPDAELPRMRANLVERIGTAVDHFLDSFSGKNRLSQTDEGTLDVWMLYGRDNVNVLQELADEYFTPDTGIRVKVNQLPREELLVMANATGQAPDVALGISVGQPAQLAMRGAAVDLTQYEGFEETIAPLAPGALQPYFFDGGYYALPETLGFKMLFYRKDILDRLGLEPPDTWRDVVTMLPTLQQNNYNFALAPEFDAFVFQFGADYWTEDGMRSALDTPEAFEGFRTLTDLYRKYGIERQVSSFYQHFRDGTMPIGISDFQTYLQLSVGAPELNGLWELAPLPGVAQPDGSVVRWAGGTQTSAMMLKYSRNKEEGWRFLRWWLSADTQERFGMALESYNGAAFRWNTANVEAFARLPWRSAELQAILDQWQWYRLMVHIPGAYFVERELNNAWNRTVLGHVNFRESLREAARNVNREVGRKSAELGFANERGDILRAYDPPAIRESWKEALRYGRE